MQSYCISLAVSLPFALIQFAAALLIQEQINEKLKRFTVKYHRRAFSLKTK